MTSETGKSALPRAALLRFQLDWGHFYFAKFRLANAVRWQIGFLIITHRAPWLPSVAKVLHPEVKA